MSPIYSAYVGNDSSETLPRILEIHMPEGGLIADVTWGRGVFWKKIQNGQPNLFNGATYTIIGSDIEQKADVRADFRSLPYRDETFDCVVLDPPFANTSSTKRTHDIGQRYALQPMNIKDITSLYEKGIAECARIMKQGGLLICKGQDIVSENARNWMSIKIFNQGLQAGLIPTDRMLQIHHAPAVFNNIKQQRHFRARESFYWIFRKV